MSAFVATPLLRASDAWMCAQRSLQAELTAARCEVDALQVCQPVTRAGALVTALALSGKACLPRRRARARRCAPLHAVLCGRNCLRRLKPSQWQSFGELWYSDVSHTVHACR